MKSILSSTFKYSIIFILFLVLYIWTLWVAKVKTKARKVRDTIQGTGGGPAGAGLTDIETKILDIVGSASVDGFTNLEAVSILNIFKRSIIIIL